MRKVCTVFLLFALMLSLVLPVLADSSALQYNYSSTSNSGRRHEVCTTLSGTKATNYYTGSYTYDNLSDLSGASLLSSLRTLMKSTHKTNTSYAQCRDLAIKTDCERNNGRIVMLYSSYSATYSQYQSGNGWNREHVWPKSLGGFETTGAGADLHHIRPAEARINSTRNNLKYGNVSATKSAGGNLSGLSGGTYDSIYFEPLDNVKGDVARICLYVYVRYGGELSKCSSITNVFQSVEVLLQWCQLDPVDTWEMGRNEVVYAIQGNRNVFIDYPEYAWLLFGREVPEGMTTPSGNADKTCTHAQTELRNRVYAECTTSGYSGDTYCLDCGECIKTGTAIPATGHLNTNTENQAKASCTTDGYTGDVYCYDCDVYISTGTAVPATGHLRTQMQNKAEPTCGKTGYTGDVYCLDCGSCIFSGMSIPATGNHNFTDWQLPPGADRQERYCLVCGYTEKGEVIPTCDHVAQFVVTVQPTCIKDGWAKEVCKKCGDVLSEGKAVPATGHQHTEIKEKKSTDCVTDGYTGDTWCTDCNTKLTAGETIPATGHRNTELRNESRPNCTTGGYTGDTWCTDCNTKLSQGKRLDATGHQHTEIKEKKSADCVTDGYTGDTWCTDCNTKLTAGETIPATGHRNTELRNESKSNCTTDGYTGDTWCTDCNTKLTAGETIPATGHQHTEIRDAIEQTCTADGYTGDTWCTDCNTKTAAGEPIPAAGHQHTEIREQKAADCVADGYSGDTFCIDCGAKVAAGETVPATGHLHTEIRNQKDATCSQEGSTGDTWCTDCGSLIKEADTIPNTDIPHRFGQWLVSPGGGEQTRSCSECGHVERETLPPTPGPEYDWGAIGITAAVVIIAAGGVAVLILFIRKKKA